MAEIERLPTGFLRPLSTTSRTLRDMARTRWRAAIACRNEGDEDGYLSRMADVRALDEQATEARVAEDEQRVEVARFLRLALDLQAAERRKETG
jgi:hypothetical protein